MHKNQCFLHNQDLQNEALFLLRDGARGLHSCHPNTKKAASSVVMRLDEKWCGRGLFWSLAKSAQKHVFFEGMRVTGIACQFYPRAWAAF
jgi:hypothetical protein